MSTAHFITLKLVVSDDTDVWSPQELVGEFMRAWPQWEDCWACEGEGAYDAGYTPCFTCKGNGLVPRLGTVWAVDVTSHQPGEPFHYKWACEAGPAAKITKWMFGHNQIVQNIVAGVKS